MQRKSPAFRTVVRSTVASTLSVTVGLLMVAACFLHPWYLVVLALYVPFQWWLNRRIWESATELWNLERDRDLRMERLETLVEVNEILLENTRTPLD